MSVIYIPPSKNVGESVHDINSNFDNLDKSKVDKISGKGLSTNDFTTAEKNKLAGLSNYDDTAVKADISALKSGKANKSDVYTKTETDGRITSKISEVVAGAPEDFDTLKEMSDWISGHEDSAAAMNTAIQKNAADISNLQTDKVDKIAGMGLSENNFTDLEKAKLALLTCYDDKRIKADIAALQSGKVDKEAGKGLSSNDYTTTEKEKLAGIAIGANKTVVDSTLSTTSTHPVQNKVIGEMLTNVNARIDNKADKTDISALQSGKVDKIAGKGLSSNDYTTTEKNKLAGLSNYNDTAVKADISALRSGKVDKIAGKGLSSNDYTTTEKNKLAELSNYIDNLKQNPNILYDSGTVTNIIRVVINGLFTNNKLLHVMITGNKYGTRSYMLPLRANISNNGSVLDIVHKDGNGTQVDLIHFLKDDNNTLSWFEKQASGAEKYTRIVITKIY